MKTFILAAAVSLVASSAADNPRLRLTVDYLPESGIRGNSHMMMLDRNNKQIANIGSWGG